MEIRFEEYLALQQEAGTARDVIVYQAARIAELAESEAAMRQRMEWTVDDNAKRRVKVADLEAEAARLRERVLWWPRQMLVLQAIAEGKARSTGNEPKVLCPVIEAINRGDSHRARIVELEDAQWCLRPVDGEAGISWREEVSRLHEENAAVCIRVDKAEAEAARLRAFAKEMLCGEDGTDWCLDRDGFDMQERAVKHGVLVKVGYDPVIDGESEYGAKAGDAWYVFAWSGDRRLPGEGAG